MLEQRLAEAASLVEARLSDLLGELTSARCPDRLRQAMAHATLSGGKRFRPFLVIEGAKLFGLAARQAVDTAAAVELLHCYSLAHDDLPAMDNDELRRGQPTVWKAFDEATAILAGDALQSLAFEILSRPETHPDPAVRADLVLGLARASGAAGMVGGQQLDMEAEHPSGKGLHTPQGVRAIQEMKTGALITFSAEAGAILASAPDHERSALVAYGRALGTAFQIADDLLDVEGDVVDVGKSLGKDASAGKATWVAILGAAGARARLNELEHDAAAALSPFANREVLEAAAQFVTRRRK
jgi:farnesyl diphosphate synthase